MRVLQFSDAKPQRGWYTPPCRVAFTPCGRKLVGHIGVILAVWDLFADTHLPEWMTKAGDMDLSMGLSVSPCGRYVVVAGDRCPQVFTPVKRAKPKWLTHPDHISDVAFTPDGKQLLTVAHEDGMGVRRWQVGSWKRLKAFGRRGKIDGRPDEFSGLLAVSPDGATVLTDHRVQDDHYRKRPAWTLKLRSLGTGRLAGAIDLGPEVPYRLLGFSPDGSRIAALLDGKRLRTWDSRTLEPTGVYEPKPQTRREIVEVITAFAYHPGGRFLAVVGDKSRCELLDPDTLQPLHRYKWPVEHPFSVAFSPDGALCAVGGQHGTVVLFDLDG
jgi:WD40 repeat protein